MSAWILALILAIAPRNLPYADTFPATAAAIDQAAHEAPLYPGEDGVERTASLLVALARWESVFDPRVTGRDASGESYGLYQIHRSNLARLGMTARELEDPLTSSRAALVLIRESFLACRRSAEVDRLAMYATGRGRCDVPEGVEASRRRVGLAEDLLRRHVPRWTERTSDGVWGY